MNGTLRPEIPQEKIIQVNNSKKINFSKPYKFIYFDWWFELLTFFPYLIFYILFSLSSIFFSFKVKGRGNLKHFKNRGNIIVSNHCHYFDTVLINCVLFPKFVYTSVAQRNFEVPYIRRLLRIVRAFPIPAGRIGLKMIDKPIEEALKRKRNVLFLPEGELVYLSQTIHRFKPGAFQQSYMHQVPVIPMVYVMKPRKVFGKELGPNWIKMTLVIGKPIIPPPIVEGGKIPRELINNMSDRAASWMEDTIKMYNGEVFSA